MTDDTIHTPTARFRDRLERDVEHAFRREAGRREQRRRRLRAAAIIAISIGIGTTTGLASGQVRDGARRDSILRATQADLAIVALRLDLARAGMEDAARKFRVGAAGPEALATAEGELRAMEAKAGRMRLNIEEIKATSQPPRDELTAPLVGSRDFVTDRIQLELAGAQQRLTAAEQTLADVESRIRIGVVNELAGSEAKLDMARARAALGVLAERLALRREFVEKGTSADQLARRLGVAEVQFEMEVAQQWQRLAQARLETIVRQHAAGVATKLEELRARVDVQEREAQLNRLALRLRQLRDARPE